MSIQVIEARQKYYKKNSNCKSNMWKSWDKIKHLLGKQTNHTEIKGILINDEIASDQSQVSSGLNENFSTIGRKLNQ